jgi:hypothetical protein
MIRNIGLRRNFPTALLARIPIFTHFQRDKWMTDGAGSDVSGISFCLPESKTGAQQEKQAVPTVVDGPDWARVHGLTEQEALDLLDWLRGKGFRDCAMSHHATEGYSIRYRVSREEEPAAD